MPLPILPSSPKTDSGVFKSIKDRILNQNPSAANDADYSKSSEPFKKVTTRPSLSNVRTLSRLPDADNQPNMGDLSFQKNQAANDKAIARSQSTMNPLIPLIQNVNRTLIGIDKNLKNILSVLENKLNELQSGMGNSGLGFGDIASAAVGGAIGAKVLKKGGVLTPQTAGAPIKPGLFAKIFGTGGASITDAAHGVRGAAGGASLGSAGSAGATGGWFSKLGKAFGTGGHVLSKVAAPLTVAMTMSEDMDDLQ